jgi:uncharacterized protein YqjF (DUF2071 family)
VGYQEWRRLLFLHWPVPPDVLRAHVPRSLAIDTFHGQAWIGLVPFTVQGARLLGVPPLGGLRFLETNVRTYVHRDGRDPGVYFFSLDAASLAAVVGARVATGLPYYLARGREERGPNGAAYWLRRATGRQPLCRFRYETGALLGPAEPGTLDHFLIERYLLHVQRGRGLWTIQVHHHPYPLRQVRLMGYSDELVAAAGITLPPDTPLVHFAAGVDVDLFAPRIRPATP